MKIEINNIIYDPIKCQIYLTDARGKPERNRPERKRKMISKIVETRSLNYEWRMNKILKKVKLILIKESFMPISILN